MHSDPRTTAARLNALLDALSRQAALGEDSRKTVMLDQQSVGRLSRMDAMQQQQMARATAARRDAEARRIRAALARLADGDYGYCTDCGEKIDPARLERDPAVPKCLDCMRG